jgi:hypothetical protein
MACFQAPRYHGDRRHPRRAFVTFRSSSPRCARKRLIRKGSPTSTERFSRDCADVPGCSERGLPVRRRPVSTAMRRVSGRPRTRDARAAADRERGAEGDAAPLCCLGSTAGASPSAAKAVSGSHPHRRCITRRSARAVELKTGTRCRGRGMTPTTVIPNAGNARGGICCFLQRRTCCFLQTGLH